MQGASRSRETGKQPDADLRMRVLSGERRPLECFAQVGRQGRLLQCMAHSRARVAVSHLTDPSAPGSDDGTPIVPACATSTRAPRGRLALSVRREMLTTANSIPSLSPTGWVCRRASRQPPLRAFIPDERGQSRMGCVTHPRGVNV